MTTDDYAYLSTKEAADVLGISLRTAQLWVENGVLQAWKTPGGHRRILKSSVDKALRERSLVPNPKSTITLRVLVVEDDPDLLNLVALTIQNYKPDIEVLIAQNGYEGLMMVGKTRPDVIFVDINMPQIDGIGMIRAIGQGDNAPRTIVIMTALNHDELKKRGALDINALVLYKPLELNQIETILAREYAVNLQG